MWNLKKGQTELLCGTDADSQTLKNSWSLEETVWGVGDVLGLWGGNPVKLDCYDHYFEKKGYQTENGKHNRALRGAWRSASLYWEDAIRPLRAGGQAGKRSGCFASYRTRLIFLFLLPPPTPSLLPSCGLPFRSSEQTPLQGFPRDVPAMSTSIWPQGLAPAPRGAKHAGWWPPRGPSTPRAPGRSVVLRALEAPHFARAGGVPRLTSPCSLRGDEGKQATKR